MTIPTWDSLQLVSEPTILGPDSIAQFNPYYYPPSQISEVQRLKQNSSVDSWAYPYSYQHSYNVEFNTQSYAYYHSSVHQYYTGDLGFNPNQYGFEHYQREAHPSSFPVPCAYHFESTNSGFYSVSEAMGVSQGTKHKRLATGGKKKAWRKKHKYELGRRPTPTKLSSYKTIRRICVGGSTSLEVEHEIEIVGNGADKMFDSGPVKDLKTLRDEACSVGRLDCGVNQVFVKCSERPPVFESKMLEFAQSLKRVEKILQQMISSARVQDNQILDAIIEIEGANDGKDFPIGIGKEVEENSENDEVQMFDESPQRASKISHEVVIPECDIENNNLILNDNFKPDSEWERIYDLICNDYESHLVHINGGGEVLEYEDEENSESKEDQVLNEMPERYANAFLELSPQSNVFDNENLDDEAPSGVLDNVFDKYPQRPRETFEEFSIHLCDLRNGSSVFKRNLKLDSEFFGDIKLTLGEFGKFLIENDGKEMTVESLCWDVPGDAFGEPRQEVPHLSQSGGAKVVSKIGSMSLPQVDDMVLVFLGFARLAARSTTSLSKLDKVLTSRPFDRPHSVSMLEVTEAVDVVYSDHKVCNFASWLSCSNVSRELIISFENEAHVFQLTGKADIVFVAGFFSLTCKFKRAVEMHQDFSGDLFHLAELTTGRFHGLMALKLCYGAVFVGFSLSTSLGAMEVKSLMEINYANTCYGQNYIQDCIVGLLFMLLPNLGGTSGDLPGRDVEQQYNVESFVGSWVLDSLLSQHEEIKIISKQHWADRELSCTNCLLFMNSSVAKTKSFELSRAVSTSIKNNFQLKRAWEPVTVAFIFMIVRYTRHYAFLEMMVVMCVWEEWNSWKYRFLKSQGEKGEKLLMTLTLLSASTPPLGLPVIQVLSAKPHPSQEVARVESFKHYNSFPLGFLEKEIMIHDLQLLQDIVVGSMLVTPHAAITLVSLVKLLVLAVVPIAMVLTFLVVQYTWIIKCLVFFLNGLASFATITIGEGKIEDAQWGVLNDFIMKNGEEVFPGQYKSKKNMLVCYIC